ncbi:MAG: hypothetical protein MZW92_78470 [Comamonadaceae bacterium]|nr:hypothetical protein [Comamonadaceae bacterium]
MHSPSHSRARRAPRRNLILAGDSVPQRARRRAGRGRVHDRPAARHRRRRWPCSRTRSRRKSATSRSCCTAATRGGVRSRSTCSRASPRSSAASWPTSRSAIGAAPAALRAGVRRLELHLRGRRRPDPGPAPPRGPARRPRSRCCSSGWASRSST